MLHRFSRTELLVGEEGLEKLSASTVAVFGVGGVGSYAVEALARSGVGHIVMVDYDDICLTNVNRQIHALTSTVGKAKVDVMRERIGEINPDCRVEAIREFYSADKRDALIQDTYNYILDAIDTVTAKVDMIKTALNRRIPIISCMGAGNKLDPTRLQVADISETQMCPMARAVRKQLRDEGIVKGVKVVFSTEPPHVPRSDVATCRSGCICTNPDARFHCAKRHQIPGSIAFVPAVAGLLMAAEAVNDIIKKSAE